MRRDVTSWGRVDRRPQGLAQPAFRDELPDLVAVGNVLGGGLRRSYGDTCLNRGGGLIEMSGLDRVIAFDPVAGVLVAEAGISLSRVLQLVVPHGWFLPVTPGTRFVTLGGAIANDVHGKNHHRAGSFGCHVARLGLLRTDGDRQGVAEGSDLFAATVGGLGLTGVIEWAEVRLVRIASAWLDVETLPFAGLDEFWRISDMSVATHEQAVAWIDTLAVGGRGTFTRANWSAAGDLQTHDDAQKPFPVELPAGLMTRATVAAGNAVLYQAGRWKAGKRRGHYAPFHYPLDAIASWNRMYGRPGFYQYQCVVPDRAAIPALLGAIAAAGQASVLAVIKTMGDRRSPGLLSFSRSGTTLALDLPNRGADTLALMARMDAVVADAGGALYPAKDGRMSGAMFRASFPRWQEFDAHRDPGLTSDFWKRVSE